MQLFEEGFDVWLGNSRGTRHSRKHINLDADRDAESYWNFSHHEFGSIDVPQMVKAIVLESGSCRKISYVGHSLGNTQILHGLGRGINLRPYFSQVVALAPCFIPYSSDYTDYLNVEAYIGITSALELM